nr:hypothetical protein TorRG33x02_046640 [Ipomoea batatas]
MISPPGISTLYTVPVDPIPITLLLIDKHSSTSSAVKFSRWNAVNFHGPASPSPGNLRRRSRGGKVSGLNCRKGHRFRRRMKGEEWRISGRMKALNEFSDTFRNSSFTALPKSFGIAPENTLSLTSMKKLQLLEASITSRNFAGEVAPTEVKVFQIPEPRDFSRQSADEVVAEAVEEGERFQPRNAGRESGIEGVVTKIKRPEKREFEDHRRQRAVEEIPTQIQVVEVKQVSYVLRNVAREISAGQIKSGDSAGLIVVGALDAGPPAPERPESGAGKRRSGIPVMEGWLFFGVLAAEGVSS